VFSIDGDIPAIEEAAHKSLRARARVRAAAALEYRSIAVFRCCSNNVFFELHPAGGIEAAHLAQAPSVGGERNFNTPALHDPGFEHEDEQKHEQVSSSSEESDLQDDQKRSICGADPPRFLAPAHGDNDRTQRTTSLRILTLDFFDIHE
jgi:hypothetical protein